MARSVACLLALLAFAAVANADIKLQQVDRKVRVILRSKAVRWGC